MLRATTSPRRAKLLGDNWVMLFNCLRARPWLAALAILLTALAALLPAPALAQWQPVGTLHGPVPLLNVTDGDTIVVWSNLGPRTIRLIGIDAPELDQRDPRGQRAAEHLRSLLPVGSQVWVETDHGLEDIYGRLLGYVYVVHEDGDWQIGAERVMQVNLVMARDGWAGTLAIAPNLTYSDLYAEAVATATAGGTGMWSQETVAAPPIPTGPITIACILFNPSTPNDADGEWVALHLESDMDTRGYYLYDQGSGVRLPLPLGVQPTGELRVHNPDQGIWNNSGDTVYLMLGDTVIDAWEYVGGGLPEDTVLCRDGSIR